MRGRGLTRIGPERAALLVAALGAVALPAAPGCGGGEETRPPAQSLATGSGPSTGAQGAATSGSGSGGDATTGAGTTGAGGSGDPDAGPDAIPPNPPCLEDVAFWADGMSFVSPTPEPLALALGDLAFDPTAHPITVVLRAGHGLEAATIAASATEDGGAGAHVFPAGAMPEFGPALVSYGGFATSAPQATAVLRVVDDVGPVDIALAGVSIEASTEASCAVALITLIATIPAAEGSKTLVIGGVTQTIAELAGGGPRQDSWPVKSIFEAESMSFDFTSLP